MDQGCPLRAFCSVYAGEEYVGVFRENIGEEYCDVVPKTTLMEKGACIAFDYMMEPLFDARERLERCADELAETLQSMDASIAAADVSRKEIAKRKKELGFE